MARIKVQAQNLKCDDVCAGSGQRILSRPSAGISTPSGKVDVKVQRRNGKVVWATWGRYTEITIERPEV